MLSFEQLKDKIYGCWNGKNIGGVLGAPFEAYRQLNDVTFYVQKDLEGNPPPNDDLDLQLVWLEAVEKYGRQIDAKILGEYWLSYITPNWVEYGTGKCNMGAGMMPPVSGYVANPYRDSCGCFIRSEIWACLCPGHPELAVRYAYEDAIVDHAGEGMYGEIFCAAVQSAAFVESDKMKLIEIGLSYLPENCGVAKAIRLVLEAYQNGVPYQETRIRLLTEITGSFGLQMVNLKNFDDGLPLGNSGYDAPSNIGIVIIGWLYGEDDFGKSLCIAVNCGEDTDCTAATLGAILGIVHGNSNLPEEWLKPIGGVITTCSINLTSGISVPKSISELSDRVMRNIPSFLGYEFCDVLQGTGFSVKTSDRDELKYDRTDYSKPYLNGVNQKVGLSIKELLEMGPFAVKYQFTTFDAILDYCSEPFIKVNEPRKLKLKLFYNGMTRHQQWVDIKLYTPDGVTVIQGDRFSGSLQNLHTYELQFEFDVLAEAIHDSRIEILIDVSVAGRHTAGMMKAVLFPNGRTEIKEEQAKIDFNK